MSGKGNGKFVKNFFFFYVLGAIFASTRYDDADKLLLADCIIPFLQRNKLIKLDD